MANAIKVPSTGTISFNDLKAAFPSTNQNNLLAYRGVRYQNIDAGNVIGYFPSSGTIDMNMFRGKIEPQYLVFANYNQDIYIGSRTRDISPGCYGAGWVDMYLRVIGGNLYIQVGKIVNDYYFYGNPATQGTLPYTFFVAGPYITNMRTTWYMPTPHGRDATKFNLLLTAVGNNLKVDISAWCKGFASDSGYESYSSVYYTSYVPITYTGGFDGALLNYGSSNENMFVYGTPNKYGNTGNTTVIQRVFTGANGSVIALAAIAAGASAYSIGSIYEGTDVNYVTPSVCTVKLNSNIVATASSSSNDQVYSSYTYLTINNGDIITVIATDGNGGCRVLSSTYALYLFR